jgi:hypothetical protein
MVVADGPREAVPTPGSVLASTAVSFSFVLAVVWFFGCRRHGLSWSEGLSLRRVAPGTIGWSVAAGILLAVVGMILLGLFGTGKSVMTKMASQPGGLAVLATLALAAPFFEEIYYRGFLYPILERKTRRAVAAAVVILWFTAVHVLQLLEDPVGLVPIFGMSVAATLFRARTGSLLPALLVHGAYNGVLVLGSLAAL